VANPRPRHCRPSHSRALPLRTRRRLAAGVLASGTLVGLLVASQTNASVSPSSDGNIVVTTPGTVIDGREVRGYIHVKADNVTITRTRVTYDGYHSIRVFDGAEGTVIEDSEITCLSDHGNGVVFGNYVARRVTITGCRNGFMYSASAPAVIEDGYWNGKRVDVRGDEAASRDETRTPGPTASPSVSPSPAATATSTPTSTSTPTATSSATATSSPKPIQTTAPSTGFPNATNTGVPAGTSLSSSGSLTVTRDGAVVDSKLVKGSITVKADNVTIRRTKIENDALYPVKIESGYRGLVVEDTEIDGNGVASVAVLRGEYTLRRVNIHAVKDGPRIEGDNVVIEDSYIHHLTRVPEGHHDTIQIRNGHNILIRHNTLLAYNDKTDDPMNAVLQVGSIVDGGSIGHVVLERNLFNGGNYTIAAGGPSVTPFAVRNNRFGRDFRFGVAKGIDSHDVWEGNVWHDSGQAIPGP